MGIVVVCYWYFQLHKVCSPIFRIKDSLRCHLQNIYLPRHLRHELPILVFTGGFNRGLGNQCPLRMVLGPHNSQYPQVNIEPHQSHPSV